MNDFVNACQTPSAFRPGGVQHKAADNCGKDVDCQRAELQKQQFAEACAKDPTTHLIARSRSLPMSAISYYKTSKAVAPPPDSRRFNTCFKSTAGELKRQLWNFRNRAAYLSNLG